MNSALSDYMREAFGGWRGQLLKALLAVLFLCAAILLIDRFFVPRPPAEDAPAVTDIATRLSLQHDAGQSQTATLRTLLGRFEPIAGAVQSIETVLWREDATHRLWVFEFKASEVVMVSSNRFRPLQRHRAGVTRLGVAVELKGRSLPAWSVLQDGDWPAPWTAGAIERAQRIEDLWLAMDGPFVVALARPDRFPLHEMVARSISPEFHPGLFNSALPIDVQRLVDVVNLLDTGAPPLARVYRIEGIEVKLPELRRPDLTGALPRRDGNPDAPPVSLEQLRAESEARMASARDKSEALQRSLSADTDAARSAMRADTERQLAEMQQVRAEAEARRKARDEELLKRLRERANAKPTKSNEDDTDEP